MDTITVKLTSGITRLVSVASDEADNPSFFYLPPHTALSTRITRIDRGENYYGSLAEDFYLATDQDSDRDKIILWIGDNGSQREGDQPRLWAAAWAEYGDFQDEENGDFKEVEAALKDLRSLTNGGIVS